MGRKRSFQPRKRPRQARALLTWNAVLDGAAQVLVQRGYDQATTDRIAERAGVSIGSVYEYFPNKEAIFASLLLRWNEQRWQVFVEARGEDEPASLEDSIRQTIRARLQAARLDPALNTALRRELPLKITQHQAREKHDEFLEVGVSALRGHVKGRRDLALMARLMMHATHAAIEEIGATEPQLLESQQLEDELTLMMASYVRGVER